MLSVSGNVMLSVSVVALCWAWLVGKPYQYVASCPGWLSLLPSMAQLFRQSYLD